MRIPFKFNEIDNLEYAIYKTKLKASIKKLKVKVNSPETAVSVFINQEFEFVGQEKPLPIVIIGTAAGAWKKWMKDSVTANKKFTLIGKGYITEDDTFKFVRLKGAVKLKKVVAKSKAFFNSCNIAFSEVEDLNAPAPAPGSDDMMNQYLEEGDQNIGQKPEDENAQKLEAVKTLIQNIAATQLDIKNHLGQVSALAKAGDSNAFNAKVGLIMTLQEQLQDNIEELKATGLANERAEKYQQNLDQIKAITSKNFKGALEVIKQIENSMKALIDEVNKMITDFEVNSGYKISLISTSEEL